MTKDLERIADIVETNAINGMYERNRRSRRRSIPTNFFIEESSKEQKQKKKKEEEEDEEDEEEERMRRRRKPSSKRKILEDSDDDDGIDTDEKETIRARKRRLVKNHRETKLLKSFVADDEDLEVQQPISIRQSVTPINEGGDTFSLINELSQNTDDENEGLRATRELVELNYQKAQQLKDEMAYNSLQSLRQNDEFDDEASSDDDDEKQNVVSVVGNNNNITINNVINQQQQLQPRFQQHHCQQQQQHYWSSSMQPQMQVNHMTSLPQIQYNHMFRYEQPRQYYSMNEVNDLQIGDTYQTPVRTRHTEDIIRLEILRIRNSGYCSEKQIEWLNRYEDVLSRKLEMFISGQQLSRTDIDWLRNEKRNRSGNRTPWQLDLITRLIELRIN
jgi:hypothetical protein